MGNARTPISVKYFLTAIVFVLFDVEVIFMYPWAVNFRALGRAGFIEMLVFMALLLAGFFYIIKKGILRWNEVPNPAKLSPLRRCWKTGPPNYRRPLLNLDLL